MSSGKIPNRYGLTIIPYERGPIYKKLYQDYQNRIGGVMVSVSDSSVIERGFEPRSGLEPKTKNMVFVASPLSMQH